MSDAIPVLVRYRLERACETLVEARALLALHLPVGATNRYYYASFQAITAWLLAHGFRTERHATLRALFNTHLVRPGLVPMEQARAFNTLFEARHRADYDEVPALLPEDLEEWDRQVDRLIATLTALIPPELRDAP